MLVSLGLTAACAPAVTEASKGATTGAVQALSQPETRREVASTLETPEVRKAVSDVAASAAAAAMRSAGRELPETVGPRMREVAREDIAPSMSDVLQAPELRAALASLAFEMSRQAVLGGNEATIELSRSKPNKGLLGRTAAIFSEGGAVAVVSLGVLALVIIALAVALVRTRGKLARLRAQSG